MASLLTSSSAIARHGESDHEFTAPPATGAECHDVAAVRFDEDPHRERSDVLALLQGNTGNPLPNEGGEHERQSLGRYPAARMSRTRRTASLPANSTDTAARPQGPVYLARCRAGYRGPAPGALGRPSPIPLRPRLRARARAHPLEFWPASFGRGPSGFRRLDTDELSRDGS
jgi:hypothetical protein